MAGQLGVELSGRILLDAIEVARKRPGPTVVTPSDIVHVYDRSYSPRRGGEAAFAGAVFFLGLGGGALFTVFGVAGTSPNPIAAACAFVALAIGFILLGYAGARGSRR